MSSIEKDVLLDGLNDWLTDMGLTRDNLLFSDLNHCYYVNVLEEDGWRQVKVPDIYWPLL